jgi:hypothetical protein
VDPSEVLPSENVHPRRARLGRERSTVEGWPADEAVGPQPVAEFNGDNLPDIALPEEEIERAPKAIEALPKAAAGVR